MTFNQMNRVENENLKFFADADGNVSVRTGSGSSSSLISSSSSSYSNVSDDFTATANSGTKTITLAGLGFTLDVKHVVAGLILKQTSSGSVSKLPLTKVSVSGNTITLDDMSSAFASGDSVYVFLNASPKAYDKSNDANDVIVNNPQYNRRTDKVSLISSSLDISSSWADLGGEIETKGYRTISLFVKLDINDGNGVSIRLLGKHTSGSTDEFTLPIKDSTSNSQITIYPHSYKFGNDADQNMLLVFGLDNAIPFVQFQVKADSVGGTAPQIDSAHIIKGY